MVREYLHQLFLEIIIFETRTLKHHVFIVVSGLTPLALPTCQVVDLGMEETRILQTCVPSRGRPRSPLTVTVRYCYCYWLYILVAFKRVGLNGLNGR